MMDTQYPPNVEAVIDAVMAARRSRVPLHPVSTGRNWGYQSSEPIKGVVLNLSRLNRIQNAADISLRQPVAVIEPGVTQGQLADFLAQHHPGLTFNVTGSARNTSIIGNALERGVGYRGPRREDLFGLEVITGAGDRLCTGFRRLGSSSPIALSHRYGLGPELDGLFFQGNFGIVVSACLRLVPRPPFERALSLSLRRHEDLGALLDVLVALKQEGLVSSVTHVGNKARTHSSLRQALQQDLMRQGLPQPIAEQEALTLLAARFAAPWTALLSIGGSAHEVRSRLREIRSRAQPWADVQVVSQRLLSVADRLLSVWPGRLPRPLARLRALLAAVQPLNGLALGNPTDEPVRNLLWMSAQGAHPVEDFETSQAGIVYISPALPMSGAWVQDCMRQWSSIVRAHGFEFYVTLNIETDTTLVAIMNLLFDKNDVAQCTRAKRCADDLHQSIRGLGLEVYRARADMMRSVTDPSDPYWQTIRKLKDVLDPDNIISPGRYNLA